MRRSYVVSMSWIVIHEYEVPGGALNLSSTNYPDYGHHGNLLLQGKIPMVETEIEPGTSLSLVKNSVLMQCLYETHFALINCGNNLS